MYIETCIHTLTYKDTHKHNTFSHRQINTQLDIYIFRYTEIVKHIHE